MDFKSLFRLEDSVAMVVGGYGGIGSELCRGLAYYGAKVTIVGRNEKKAKALANELERAGQEALGLAGDICRSDDDARLVQKVMDQFGRIDIMINCAGTQVDRPAEEYKEEDWDQVVDLNLKGAFLIAQAAGKVMIKQKRGKIINISSVRSLLGIRSGYVAYCSSKGGMNMLIKQLASEWAKYNINVNGIAPTFIRTDLVSHYLNDKEFYERLVNRIPLARVGEPMDLVGATIFLASPASDFMTGQILFVDGGVTACQ
jgi:gluconate 5-dehydrogenase